METELLKSDKWTGEQTELFELWTECADLTFDNYSGSKKKNSPYQQRIQKLDKGEINKRKNFFYKMGVGTCSPPNPPDLPRSDESPGYCVIKLIYWRPFYTVRLHLRCFFPQLMGCLEFSAPVQIVRLRQHRQPISCNK